MSNLATIVNNILADSGIDDINVVVTTGSYTNPSWIVSLPWTKITGTPTTLAGYGITDAYTQTQVNTLLNAKQNTLTLTTTGTSGAATLVGATLNIPQYQSVITNPVTGTGTAGQVAYWSSGSQITGESNLFWDATNDRLGIGTASPVTQLSVIGQIVGGTTGFTSGMIGFSGLGSYNSSIEVENIDSLYLRKGGTDDSTVSIALASAGGDNYFVGARIKHIRTGSNSNGHLAFETKSDGSANITTERMRITSSGRVLIGTPPPTESTFALDVNGTGRFSSTVTATSFIRSGGTSSQFLKADGSVDSNAYITGNQTITLSGVVTGSGTTAITTAIANGAITNAMLANSSFFVGTTSISLGRASAAQTLTGVSIDGNASSVTNGVYTTGNQTIAGIKTFSESIVFSNPGVINALDLSNNNIVGVNNIIINDPGPNEGIEWAGGNLWKIYESPNDLTTNSSGSLQIVQNLTRRATFNTLGQLELPITTGTAPFVIDSTTRVANLNVATSGNADTWTTGRTITIGNTGKSVNGSANVAWSLAEIGAYAATNPSAFIALTALSGTAPIEYNNTTGAISITQASGSTNGFLSSTDWNTFNNKTSNVGTVTSVAALTLGTTGTDLSSSVANGTTTPVITLNVPTASAANRGALSAADWTTFNNKQNALTNPVTGTGTAGQVAYWSSSSAITGESNLFWDTTNDRLGIGTAIPKANLHVKNGSTSLSSSTVTYSSTTAQGLILDQQTNTNNNGSVVWFNNDDLFAAIASGRPTTSNWGTDLRFYTHPDATTNQLDVTERMRITAAGRLLINTQAESTFQLDVNGTGRFSGNLLVSNSTDTYPEFRTAPIDADVFLGFTNTGDGNNAWGVGRRNTGEFWITNFTGNFNSGTRTTVLALASTGAATFSSSVTAETAVGQIRITPTGWRDTERATILVRTKTNNPAEIDLQNTISGANYGWQFSSRDTTTPDLFFYSNSNGNFQPKLLLKFNGNLLVGTTTDAGFKLDVNGTGRFSSAVAIGAGTQAINSDADLTLRDGVAFAGLDFKSARTSGNVGGLRFYNTSSDSVAIAQQLIETDGKFVFYNGTSGAEPRLTIDSIGSVGIGTVSPVTQLSVIGQIVGGTTGFTSGMIGFSGLGSYNSSTEVENIDALYLRKGGTNDSTVSIALASAGGDNYFVGARIKHIRTGSNSNGHLAFETKSDGSANITTERMRITSGGNTELYGNLSLQAAATGSTATHVPVFIADPASTTRSLLTRTLQDFKFDVGSFIAKGVRSNAGDFTRTLDSVNDYSLWQDNFDWDASYNRSKVIIEAQTTGNINSSNTADKQLTIGWGISSDTNFNGDDYCTVNVPLGTGAVDYNVIINGTITITSNSELKMVIRVQIASGNVIEQNVMRMANVTAAGAMLNATKNIAFTGKMNVTGTHTWSQRQTYLRLN